MKKIIGALLIGLTASTSTFATDSDETVIETTENKLNIESQALYTLPISDIADFCEDFNKDIDEYFHDNIQSSCLSNFSSLGNGTLNKEPVVLLPVYKTESLCSKTYKMTNDLSLFPSDKSFTYKMTNDSTLLPSDNGTEERNKLITTLFKNCLDSVIRLNLVVIP